MLDSSTEPKPRDPRALNAYRHGLTGQIHILTAADRVAYDHHCRGIHQCLAPIGALEIEFAQSVADDRWRLKRATAIENSIFARGLAQPDDVTAGHPEIDAALAQARVWLDEGKNLQLLSLYAHRIQRDLERNLQILRQLQADRQAALKQAAEESELLAQLAAGKGESYDPERDFPREMLPPQFDFSNVMIARLVIHNRRLAQARKQLAAPPKAFCNAV